MAAEAPTIPLLTPYKLGKFNLSHRYIEACVRLHVHLTMLMNDLHGFPNSEVLKWCKDTIPARPSDIFGFTRERSLTIRFVESGLEKLGLGHGGMVRSGFQKDPCGKWTGLKRLKPRHTATSENGILGLDPRTLVVLSGCPTEDFLCSVHGSFRRSSS
uniref:Uncharacterized protein n=1 Tax=Quercus lobata TaxID=97700 RepID=A0A7N2RA88_QUELO